MFCAAKREVIRVMTLRCQTGMELDYCGFSILDACLGVTLWQAETPALLGS